ncbi:MAG: hypothetical protein GF347_00070 [Candidatus Moranbacteria bacterium]|nr:hypothetical protein [Candidatus Moranbacteria bacterium]
MFEKYKPTEADFRKAEDMMTSEQKRASEIRERYWEQKQPNWGNFEKEFVENSKRKPAGKNEIEIMDRNIEALGDALEGFEGRWVLDGSLNISLMKEEYIGLHKDMDISVEEADLKALEEHLDKKGYGLFFSEIDGKDRIARRVGHRKFADLAKENIHGVILAIDKDGKIDESRDWFVIDVHVLAKNDKGNPIGFHGAKFSEEWMQTTLRRGINVSHPARVLYYKMYEERSYDVSDVKELMELGRISSDDLDEVERVLREDNENLLERVRRIVSEVFNDLSDSTNQEEIYRVFNKHPEVIINDEEMEKGFRELSRRIGVMEDFSLQGVLGLVLETFNIDRRFESRIERIRNMREKSK